MKVTVTHSSAQHDPLTHRARAAAPPQPGRVYQRPQRHRGRGHGRRGGHLGGAAEQPPARRPARQGHREIPALRMRPRRYPPPHLGLPRRCPGCAPPRSRWRRARRFPPLRGASFGNLRKGSRSDFLTCAFGNLRDLPLRGFPSGYRRTMELGNFRRPSSALSATVTHATIGNFRLIPLLSSSNSDDFRWCLRGGGGQCRKCPRTLVILTGSLGSIANLTFSTPILPRTSDVLSAARPMPEQPTRGELLHGSFLRRDKCACATAEGFSAI